MDLAVPNNQAKKQTQAPSGPQANTGAMGIQQNSSPVTELKLDIIVTVCPAQQQA